MPQHLYPGGHGGSKDRDILYALPLVCTGVLLVSGLLFVALGLLGLRLKDGGYGRFDTDPLAVQPGSHHSPRPCT